MAPWFAPRRRSGAGGTAAAKPFCSYSDDRFSGGGTGNLFVASDPGIDHVFRGGTGHRAALPLLLLLLSARIGR